MNYGDRTYFVAQSAACFGNTRSFPSISSVSNEVL